MSLKVGKPVLMIDQQKQSELTEMAMFKTETKASVTKISTN